MEGNDLPARNFVGQLVGNICRENVLKEGKHVQHKESRFLAQDGGRRRARQRLFWSCFGADLESTSRKHRVTVATLSEWRERFLAGGEAMLKSRENDAEDEEVKRLKSVVAGVCVDNELLREKITRLENGRPLAFWRSKP